MHLLWIYKIISMLLIISQMYDMLIKQRDPDYRDVDGRKEAFSNSLEAYTKHTEVSSGFDSAKDSSNSTMEADGVIETGNGVYSVSEKEGVSFSPMEQLISDGTQHKDWNDDVDPKYRGCDYSTNLDLELRSRTFESFQLASSPVTEDGSKLTFIKGEAITTGDQQSPPSKLEAQKSFKVLGSLLTQSVPQQLYSKSSDMNEAPQKGLTKTTRGHTTSRNTIKSRAALIPPSDSDQCTSQEELDFSDAIGTDVIKRAYMSSYGSSNRKRNEVMTHFNGKLLKTLNLVIKENKDVNEKLRVVQQEKAEIVSEFEEAGKQIVSLMSNKSHLQADLERARQEKLKIESVNKKLSNCNYSLQMKIKDLENQLKKKEEKLLEANETISQEQIEKKDYCNNLKAAQSELQAKENLLQKLLTSAKEEESKRESLVSDLQKICNGLDRKSHEICKELSVSRNSKRKEKASQADMTLETELFLAIENNVKLESVVNDIKGKLTEFSTRLSNACERLQEGRGQSPNNHVSKLIQPVHSTSLVRKPKPRSKSFKLRDKDSSMKVQHKAVSGDLISASKIKEIITERDELQHKNKELMKRIIELEEELSAAKRDISLLVTECGNLDRELVSLKSKRSQKHSDTKSLADVKRQQSKDRRAFRNELLSELMDKEDLACIE